MRILHVVDLTAPAAGPAYATAASIAAIAGDHAVWAVGSPADSPIPGALRVDRSIPATLGSTWSAWPALRSLLAASDGRFGLLVGWSPSTLALLHAAAPRRAGPPIVGVLPGDPEPAHVGPLKRLLRRALASHPLAVFSETAERRWRDAGAADLRLVNHAFLPTTVRAVARDRAREALGIGPTDRVVSFLADPPSLGDAKRFAYLVGLLNVGGARCTGTLHVRNVQFRRAARFMRACGRAWPLIAWSGPIDEILAASDAILCDARVPRTHPLTAPEDPAEIRLTAGPLSMGLAIARGPACVAPCTPETLELVRRGVPLILAPDASVPSLAACVLGVLDKSAPVTRPPASPTGPGASLADLFQEQLRFPLPGFPLSLRSPAPRRTHVAPAAQSFITPGTP